MQPSKILPVLLGADMNCYSVARAFHEAYGIKSQAFGRYPLGETKYSKIVKFTAVENIDTDKVLVETLRHFAKQHPEETKILLGCTDDYAELCIRNKDALAADYIVPYIGTGLKDKLVSKASFYEYCEEHNIPYPATVVLDNAADTAKLDSLPFSYPVILKPSSSILYWKHPFDGMKKVYLAKDAAEAKAITGEIYAAGYPDKLIVQDRIPGGDDRMRVLTAYCNGEGRVRWMCLGHVLLEEHTPKGLGNHAAILTEYNEELMLRLKSFLEAIGYTGFANFDVKLDERDGSYRVFEINLRQGRSNYYVTGAGLNIAEHLVNDCVLHSPFAETLLFKEERFWHSIPADIVWEYTADEALVEKCKAIVAKGQDTTALGYKYDLRLNPLRWLYVREHYRRYYEKYAKWCEKPARGSSNG